jgi:serine protease Do
MMSIWQTGMVLIAAAALAAPAGLAQNARARTAGSAIGSPYLGVGVLDIDSERAKTLKLKEERGVEVSRVDRDSPAAKGGIQPGDVILEYNDQPVQSGPQLQRMVRESVPGRQVKVIVWRNGAVQTLNVTIEAHHMADFGGDWPFAVEMPSIPQPPAMPEMPVIEIPRMVMVMQNSTLGILGESLGDEQQFAEYFGVKDGVLVKAVMPGSAAERSGLKAGDVIVKVGDARVGTSRELAGALRTTRGKGSYTVTIVRNKKETTLTVSAERQNGALFGEGQALAC